MRSSRCTTNSAKPPAYSTAVWFASSITWSATASMKSRSWLTNRTEPSNERSACSSHATESVSRWLVGSSRISTSGADSSSRASAARIRQPPESSVNGPFDVGVAEAEAGQDAASVRLQRVAAQLLEPGLRLAVGGEHPVVLGARRRSRCVR